MKKGIETFKNIFKIKELKDRILLTLGLILIYRVGAHVVLPGINGSELQRLVEDNSGTANGLLQYLDMFAGGAFNRASIFALGIMPYISASIVFQLLGLTIPAIQKMQKEGESSRRKLNQWVRLATIVITLFQASAYVTYLTTSYGGAVSQGINTSLFWLTTTVVLTSGTIFVMWLGEKITDKGIGNGISLLIMVGIIARLPQSFLTELDTKGIIGDGVIAQPLMVLIELVFFAAIVLVSIALLQAVRRIPVTYARKVAGRETMIPGARQYIPLKLNGSGVMPIIFAQALMFVPAMLGQFGSDIESLDGIVASLMDPTGVAYNAVLFVMVIAFTYFYTAILFNPQQMSEDLKKNSAFVPGIKPGAETSEHIDTIMSRITLPGAILLGIITILPAFAAHPSLLGVQREFSMFFGGTSLLILVGVVLDTLQQIDSYLLMQHYDGLTDGKMRGRNEASPVSTTTAI
jgi:preprotein translocase subunit SecY